MALTGAEQRRGAHPQRVLCRGVSAQRQVGVDLVQSAVTLVPTEAARLLTIHSPGQARCHCAC
jgi:hypothetical protein